MHRHINLLLKHFDIRYSLFFFRYSVFFTLLLCAFVFFLPSLSGAADTSLEKEMQQHLAQSRSLIQTIQEKRDAGLSITSELNRLRALAQDIRAIHMLLEERFRARQEKVNTLGANAAARHSAMWEGYREVLDEYLDLTETLSADEALSSATLEALKALIDSILPEKRRPIFGAVPYRNLNYPLNEPLDIPAMEPAYRGGDGTVAPEDLESTPEAPITGEIAALAQSLDWNPVLIYGWVKNNIETEWYWGIMKGAEGTLRQGSGNDADQAALLVALLRASGFPARYIRGIIEFFPDLEKAKNLIGLEDEMELAAFFQKAGIPYTPVIAGGGIVNFRIEHIWVETRVPYANYRGAVIDEHGKTWLGLETSLKVMGYTYNEPEDLPEEIALSGMRESYLEDIQAETPLQYIQGETGDYLEQYLPGTTYEDLLQVRTFLPEEVEILPASLQFRQIAVPFELGEYPVVEEGQPQSACDVPPPAAFVVRRGDVRPGHHAGMPAEDRGGLVGAAEHPGDHHVDVRRVVRPWPGRPGYPSWYSSGPMTPRIS